MAVPTDVRITDLRIATLVGVPFRSTIIRLDTNIGVSGYGEVRDGASSRYALMLKRTLLGRNPLDVSACFDAVRQFGYHGRQAGGVSGVDMALHDLAGRILEVPAYMLMGGRYLDRVRCYADTPTCTDPRELADHLLARRAAGFTFLKMDLGVNLLWDVPGALIAPEGARRDQLTMHPFAGIQLTEKGLAYLVDYVKTVRDIVGYDVPIAVDHVGHIAIDSCMRLGRALEPFTLAWIEDMVPWQFTGQWRQLTEGMTTPTCTGEDIYGRDGFVDLIENEAVRIIHPDPATSGGLAETKKIGDYAAQHGIGMALHMAATPIATLAATHIAAATQSFLALE